jgi:hypothetical protein
MFIDPLFEKVAKIVDPEDKLSGGAIIKLVEEKFTSTNSAMMSASQIIHQLRSWSADERKSFFDEIEEEYCFLCGSEQKCYCAPCYDE